LGADGVRTGRTLDIASNSELKRRIDMIIDKNKVEGRWVGAVITTFTSVPFHHEQSITVNKIKTHLTVDQVTVLDLDKSSTAPMAGEFTCRAVPNTRLN
jgi:hypothetical protein